MRPRIAYLPGDSLLHRLHPLVKIGWMLAGTILLFAVGGPCLVLAIVALELAGFGLARLPLHGLAGARLILTTAVLLAVLQVALIRTGTPWLRLGPLAVTSAGVEAAVYVAGRFIGIILLSYLFVLTTEPNRLAYGLMQAGLPYRYGFALVTALRLVPMFEQEARTVYTAQLARGVRYDVRGPRRLVTLARQFFLPLLVSALGKVDALAVSMEGRCFGKHPTRTFLYQVPWTRADRVAAAGLGLIGALAVGLSVLR